MQIATFLRIPIVTVIVRVVLGDGPFGVLLGQLTL